mgnify:FL=1
MEPLYPKGSLCVINTSFPPEKLKAYDVIVYRSTGGQYVFHRIIEIHSSKDHRMLISIKGDANSTAQRITLSTDNYVGKKAFVIPKLGQYIESLRYTLPFIYFGIIVLLVITELPKNKKESEETS